MASVGPEHGAPHVLSDRLIPIPDAVGPIPAERRAGEVASALPPIGAASGPCAAAKQRGAYPSGSVSIFHMPCLMDERGLFAWCFIGRLNDKRGHTLLGRCRRRCALREPGSDCRRCIHHIVRRNPPGSPPESPRRLATSSPGQAPPGSPTNNRRALRWQRRLEAVAIDRRPGSDQYLFSWSLISRSPELSHLLAAHHVRPTSAGRVGAMSGGRRTVRRINLD